MMISAAIPIAAPEVALLLGPAKANNKVYPDQFNDDDAILPASRNPTRGGQHPESI